MCGSCGTDEIMEEEWDVCPGCNREIAYSANETIPYPLSEDCNNAGIIDDIKVDIYVGEKETTKKDKEMEDDENNPFNEESSVDHNILF